MIGTSKNIWGFDPRSVPGCQLWLDAADSNTMTLSGSSVVTVLDKSGNGKTLSGGSGWSYNVTKFNGSYPSFYRATTGSMLGQNTTFSLTSSNIVLFFVGMLESAGSTTSQVYFTDGAGVNTGRFYNYADYTGGLDNVNIVHGDTQTAANYTITNRRIFSPFIFSQSAGTNPQTGSINGIVFNASAGTVGSMTVTGLTIGGPWNTDAGALPYTWPGHICEVLIYSSALTTSQRQQVEGYLAHKWGLTAYYDPTIPLSIPGCSVWFDAADTSTITGSSTVTAWRDKSSNSWNATTLIGTAPTNTTVNGNNAVSFSGQSTLTVSNVTFSSVQSRAIFVVYRVPTSAPDYITWFSTEAFNINNQGGHNNVVYPSGGSGPRLQSYAVGGAIQGMGTDSAVSTIGTTAVACMIHSAVSTSSNVVTLNGTSYTLSVNTLASGYGSGTVTYYIGNADPQAYILCEYILYQQEFTVAQRQTIEGYLARKWGITSMYSALPSTHLYYSLKPHLRVFQPTDITGCQLWLDASDTTTISPSAGGTLTSWTDKSGTGKTITINSAPSYSTTGFNGSYPSMTFTSGNNLRITIPSVGTGDIAVFAVWRQTTANTQHNVFSIGTPGGGTETALGWNNGEGRYKFYRYAGPQSVNNAATNNANVIGSALQVSGLRTLHINGVAPSATGTESYNQTNTTAFIGGGTFPLVGQLAELIFYIGTITTTQRQQVEGYLAHKWELTTPIPSTHPFKSFPSSTVTRPNFKELAYTGNDYNVYFAKYSPDGSVLWALRWTATGGIGFQDSATDSSGNVYVTGLYISSSLLMYDTNGVLVRTLANSGGYDGVVAKYTSSGVLLWTSRHVNAVTSYPTGVAVDSSGNVYAGGTWDGSSLIIYSAGEASSNTYGTTGGQTDGYIVKYNSSGIVQWSAKVVCSSYDQGGMSVKTDSSGNVYSVGINVFAAPTFYNANGTTGGSLPWGGTTEGAWLAKWNSSGTFQWALRFVTGDLNTSSGALSIDSSANLYVSSCYDSTLTLKNTGDATAATMTNSGGYDGFLVKYSSAGSYIWNARVGGTGNSDDIANAIDGSGNVYIMGRYTGTIIVYTSGEASSTTLTNSGGYDNYIAKYTSAGVLLWATRIASAGNEYHKGISVDSAGNVYAHGGYEATVTFFNVDGGTGGTLTNVGFDAYLAKYTTSGTFVWAARIGGSSSEFASRSITDPEGNIYVGGIYNSSPLTLNGV